MLNYQRVHNMFFTIFWCFNQPFPQFPQVPVTHMPAGQVTSVFKGFFMGMSYGFPIKKGDLGSEHGNSVLQKCWFTGNQLRYHGNIIKNHGDMSWDIMGLSTCSLHDCLRRSSRLLVQSNWVNHQMLGLKK